MSLQLSLAVTALLVAICEGLPDGAPLSACTTLRPSTRPGGDQGFEGHKKPPQNEWRTTNNPAEAPFFIEMRNHTYTPLAEITMNVRADTSVPENRYIGVLLQARRVTCVSPERVGVEDVPLGIFNVPNPTLLKTIDCSGKRSSAVTHKSIQFKINEMVTWTAPNSMTGHIVFKATFVKHKELYWTEVNSTLLMDPGSPPPPHCRACWLQSTSSVVIVALLATLLQSWSFVH